MHRNIVLNKFLKNEQTNKPAAKWGLVLSGGGTKGAYEIGAWKAIRELRIPIRGITGTSIGALNAAMFLCCDLKKIENIYRNIRLSDVLPVEGKIDPNKNIFDPVNLLSLAREYLLQKGLDNRPLRNMLNTHLDIDKIYASDLDLGIVTYNIKSREAFALFKEDIERDKLIDYLLASANFPIYKAQIVNNRQFMDGGLYDNMPFNPLIERRYTHLIVIDINGIGMTRKLENSDKVYLKMVSCSEDLGGTFEFNKDRIERNMKLGYLDTMKAFHRLFGSYYFFRRAAFNDLLVKFDLDTIWGLETAAKIYNIDRYRIYKADEFLVEIEKRHAEAEQKYFLSSAAALRGVDRSDLRRSFAADVSVPSLVQSFTDQPSLRGGPLAKAFPDLANAAMAIIALRNYRKL